MGWGGGRWRSWEEAEGWAGGIVSQGKVKGERVIFDVNAVVEEI